MTSATVDLSAPASPAEATAALSAMERRRPPVDLTAPPKTRQDAQAQLAALQADEKWAAGFLGGGMKERKQFDDLMQLIHGEEAAGDQLDRIVDGTEPVPEFETVVDGNLTISKQKQSAGHMKSFGLNDAETRQALTSAPVKSREEYEWAKELRAELLSDPELGRKLTSGDRELTKDFLRMSAIIANGVEEKAT